MQGTASSKCYIFADLKILLDTVRSWFRLNVKHPVMLANFPRKVCDYMRLPVDSSSATEKDFFFDPVTSGWFRSHSERPGRFQKASLAHSDRTIDPPGDFRNDSSLHGRIGDTESLVLRWVSHLFRSAVGRHSTSIILFKRYIPIKRR
jgi:hypothetical protein